MKYSGKNLGSFIRTTLTVVLVLVFLYPAKAIARLGPSTPFPELKGILQPSQLYPWVILPSLCIALVILFILYRRSKLAGEVKVGSLVWIVIFTVGSGLWLFWALPSVYIKFHNVFVEFEVEPMDLPGYFWPPMIAMASIGWGIFLLLLWFLLQPIILQSFRRSPTTTTEKKPLTWPLLLFTIGFTVWFVLAMFRPLIVLKG